MNRDSRGSHCTSIMVDLRYTKIISPFLADLQVYLYALIFTSVYILYVLILQNGSYFFHQPVASLWQPSKVPYEPSVSKRGALEFLLLYDPGRRHPLMIPTMFAISVTSSTGTRSPTLLSSGDKSSCCQGESRALLTSAHWAI